MKRLAVIFLILWGCALGVPKFRNAIFSYAGISLEDIPLPEIKIPFLSDLGGKLKKSVETVSVGAQKKWTLADGKEVDAVLVSADSENVQLRIVNLQGVYQAPLRLLSEADREHVQSVVRSKGKDGVLGRPLNLKTNSWPEQWKGAREVPLERIGETNRWKSENFEITDTAGLNLKAMESIVSICESVDGALNALPLPLPVNWGRPEDEMRKILIEPEAPPGGMSQLAGYWDPQTGIVHVFADLLLEPDHQLVVFEFNKPEKVQKYDTIVHEVTHQSTAALLHLGVPAWVPEGLAEYMAATQYAPAAYQFTNTHELVEYHINKSVLGDRIVKDRRMHLTFLKTLMNRDIRTWNEVAARGDEAGRLQYDESLILIDYFVHRDHSDGLHFRRYLECVMSGMSEEEAREVHLLRGRTYKEIEQKLIGIWSPLGLTIDFQDEGRFLAGDVAIDWAAEDVKRTIAAKRASEDESE